MKTLGTSMTQYATSRAKRLAIWISVAGFIVATILIIGGGLIAYYQRLDYAARAVETSIGSSLAVGDTFQLNRMMSSLGKSEGVLAVAVREAHYGKIIASDGELMLLENDGVADSRRFRLIGRATGAFVVLKHSVGYNGETLGILYIACGLPIGFFLSLLSIVAVLFFMVSFFIVDAAKRTAVAVTRPTELLAEQLNISVEKRAWTKLRPTDLRFTELIAVQDKFDELLNGLAAARERETQVLKEALVGRIATKVRHDVNQALLASNAVLKRLSGKSEDVAVMNASLQRIELTVNEIPKIKLSAEAETSPSADLTGTPPTGIHLLASLLQPVCSEFRAVIADSGKEIDLTLEIPSDRIDLFVDVQPTRFKRMMANLLANSVEAIQGDGKVAVSVSAIDSMIRLRIEDSGKGIPEKIRSTIGQRGVSSKPNGSGVGLSSAIEYVNEWNGNLRIDSKPGVFTRVEISLPMAPPDPLFLSALVIPTNTHLIVLDDDPTVHEIWRTRLKPGELSHMGISVSWFFESKKAELLVERLKTDGTDFMILADYDLGNGTESGLDVIRRLGVCDRSVVISSSADELHVIRDCKSASVPLVPKALQQHIPIQVT